MIDSSSDGMLPVPPQPAAAAENANGIRHSLFRIHCRRAGMPHVNQPFSSKTKGGQPAGKIPIDLLEGDFGIRIVCRCAAYFLAGGEKACTATDGATEICPTCFSEGIDSLVQQGSG